MSMNFERQQSRRGPIAAAPARTIAHHAGAHAPAWSVTAHHAPTGAIAAAVSAGLVPAQALSAIAVFRVVTTPAVVVTRAIM